MSGKTFVGGKGLTLLIHMVYFKIGYGTIYALKNFKRQSKLSES